MFVSCGLSHAECGFVSGFVQAEGHFAICEQNGGQSIACRFSLRLRDDDTQLIAWLQQTTGLGAVQPVPARRTSAPQSEWIISRRSELRSFSQLLTQHRMYGRKAAEVAAWQRAVAAWDQDQPDRATMRTAWDDVIRRRAYSDRHLPVDISVPPRGEMRHYLGGLLTGDGHFSLSGGRPSMVLRQRHDELPLLRAICRSVGLGSVYEDRTGPGNPRATWVVFGARWCLELAEVLESTIRGRKVSEFEIWSQTVRALATEPRTAAPLVKAADRRLKALRRYRPPQGRLRRPPVPRVSTAHSLDALRAFAAEHDDGLDSGSYMTIRGARHPEWPTRDTIARHFGSWHAALEAAGLGNRAASPPERHANRSRTVFDRRRIEQRERVLASVRRFVAEVGRVPRAMEYFRWRLETDPETPTQATVYKLFPGGWNAVLEAM